MAIKRISWFSAVLMLVSALILTNCKKENNNLGLNIQPPNDKLNVVRTDTTSIVAYSQIMDSIKSDETTTSVIGSLVDPVFGQSTASLYSQFRLAITSWDFGDNPVPDSLVLALDYDGFYGDSTSALTFRVYEMASQINIDSSYYSNQTVPVNETLLAEKTFVPDFSDSVIVLTDTLAPHLRINLTDITDELAQKLISIPIDSLESNTSFLNYFYGLYVECEPATSGGDLIYFNLLSSLSAMILYYHNDSEDSLTFGYVINSNCARFGHYDHDYSLGDPAFKAQLIDKDTSLGNNTCYLQSLGGIRTFLRFPNIKNYYDSGKIAVNEARLFLKCAETDPTLGYAAQLAMIQKSNDTTYIIMNDQLEGASYFGGSFDDNYQGYWFRITETIQSLMRSTDPDYGFELYLSGGSINGERVLLNGPDPALPVSSEDRMKLVITYTTLN